MSRGWVLVTCCLPLGLFSLAGCFLPYAYPNLSYVPGCEISTQMQDCHVFRVDVTAYQADAGEYDEYSVVEIPRRPDGSYPPQFGVSVDRGVYVLGGVLNYNIGRFHSTMVRLYRPGYNLIELEPWDSSEKVQWHPAANFAEQEKAIDALLLRPLVVTSPNPASNSASHRNPWDGGYTSWKATDVFVIGEYERIAAVAPTPEDAARLRDKAEKLRNPKPKQEANAAPPTPTPKSP